MQDHESAEFTMPRMQALKVSQLPVTAPTGTGSRREVETSMLADATDDIGTNLFGTMKNAVVDF
jgi:hypothetical protein